MIDSLYNSDQIKETKTELCEVPGLFVEMSNLTLTGVLRVFTYKTQMSQPLISLACYVRVPTRK